ncbi:MAG: wax ester/triacylglycerol synthase family O-acyltransferase [Burkholderiales bacterium PBB5]|nr:MAG: wax ester/triacylglycerol synthase family O-acyltransferase [Burkholderiales bacterium PBB5]
MSTPAASRMSRVDTAWLRMDNDVNLMMIVGVWLLTPAISLATLRERIETRLLKYPRFRQKAVLEAMSAHWVDDDAFDLHQHVVAQPLPRHRGQSERAALQQLCGTLAVTPLDPARPLWQFHLVEHYEGGCALVLRVHHCIADGIALISVMNAITDGGSDPPQRRVHAEADDEGHGDWLSDAVLKPLTDDSPTRLKGKPAGHKVVAWGEPLPLDVVKVVSKAFNCSINDVLLSCVSGAIGGWLRAQGDDTTGAEIRAMVPVNLRPLEKAWQLGNRFGLAPLTLPIGITNPVERLYAVRARMAQLKGSYQPLLAFAVLAVSGLFIKPVQDAVLGLFAKKTTAVMTNVPGPAQPLKFCGATLRQTMFWVPASGDVGVGVSILSYGGGVQFGLITDAAMCAEPQAIIDRFEPEFQQLLMLSLMLPWGDQAAA